MKQKKQTSKKKSSKVVKKQVEAVVELPKPVIAAEPVKVAAPKPSEADKIWAEISGVKVSMFALPPKPLSDLVEQIKLDPGKCFVKYDRRSSVLPAMEEALRGRFNVELLNEKFIVITRKLV